MPERPCQSCGYANTADVRYCRGCGVPVATAPAPSQTSVPTSVAAGRYRIERFLGEGGRKRVYLAHDTRLGRDVALALLKTEGLDPAGVVRLRREAVAMGRLGHHPNIVTVYDVGEEGGQPYIVSQFVPGGSVEDLLAAADGRRLSLGDALRIAGQVAAGLAHAHGLGIVHRDVKPRNVWMAADGSAMIGDFGLAVQRDVARLTVEGIMVGTAHYMPPEQAVGHDIDARSDLYSVGAMLYEMLCGRPPFVGDDAVAVVTQHINVAPVAPSWHVRGIPREVEELMLRLLAKSPEERPQTAAEVADALDAAAARVAEGPEAPAAHEANPLDRLAGGVFVGRDRELTELRAAMDDALSGRGRVVLLVGEAGIGKTRMAEELTTYATLRGARVLAGRCFEGEGAPAYWPWLQVIRAYVREREPEALAAEAGPGAAEIAGLVPELGDRIPGLAAAPSLEGTLEEPGQGRFRLFDSITAFLKSAAAARPLAVVLDDLHWADAPSLFLLRFLAHELRDARLLVLGTYRDEELTRQHPLAQALGELSREHLAERVLLRGLTAADVSRFIEISSGITPPDPLVATVYRQTEGNPFFLSEVVHLLASEGRFDRADEVASWTVEIPQGVREVVGRRLDHLGPECNRVLTVASALGQEFSLDVLERVADVERGRLLEAIDEAVAARVVAEVPDAVGRYRFSHTLVRETLYDELGITRRVSLHRQIATVLETLHAPNLDAHLSEIAHHFFEAALAGDVERAIDYSVRAGERAAQLLAYEEAALHDDRALQLLDLTESSDDPLRGSLLLALGHARWRVGDIARAREAFVRAADVARRSGDARRLARAALGYGGRSVWVETGTVDEPLVALLEESLRALPEQDSGLRAALLARLAIALYWAPESEERREALSREAVEMARRTGGAASIAYALSGRHWATWVQDNARERLALATEMLRTAEEAGDKELALQARQLRIVDLLELGDITEADREIETYGRGAEELRQPYYLSHARLRRAMRALMDGRFDESERFAAEALEIGRRAGNVNVGQWYAVQMFTLRREQGRIKELEKAVEGILLDQLQAMPAARVGLAFIYSLLGREEQARAAFESLAVQDFRDFRHEVGWLVSMVMLAQVCTMLDDKRRAAALYDLILPFEDLNVVVGPSAAASFGPASYYLGLLATTLGREKEAEVHFERALQMSRRTGARPMVAHTQCAYAALLIARGEHARALALVSDALATARGLGMTSLVERSLALKLAAQGSTGGDTTTSIGEVSRLVQTERPDLRAYGAPDGRVTILFTDIEGYTQITERLGDAGAQALLRTHHAAVREQVAKHDGFVVKSAGDGFMVVFADPNKAVSAAVSIQRAIAAAALPEQIKLRIGLHAGEAIHESDDFYGRNVIVAARIADAARGGEILVSEQLRQTLDGEGAFTFEAPRDLELRGLRGTHRVRAVAW